MIKISVLPNYKYCNTNILADEQSREMAVVDPTCSRRLIPQELSGYNLKYVILTHGHFDHMMKVDEWLADGGLLCVSKDDSNALTDPDINCSAQFGERLEIAHLPDKLLGDGDTLSLGKNEMKILVTPGHTPGSICLLVDNIMISGDTLFRETIGRCDFPGGSLSDMRASLARLNELSGEYEIYPGHGEKTTLSHEKKYNSYLNGTIYG
jgi:glyoxylase-like metal-dependent hydrolase (beta-lactamase superfamily II)